MRALFLLTLLGLAASTGACAQPSAPQTGGHTVLDDTYSALRDHFNAGRGRVRLLFVVDSKCPMCLKGMADIDDALLAHTDDPRLDTFVVHVPVIGGTKEDIAPSAQLLHNTRVHHYWNASGEFGRRLSAVAKLTHRGEPVYAWDVWMVFGPDAVWEGIDPPIPDVLMHQLPHLTGFDRLDAEQFAREVQQRLDALPKSDAAGGSP